MTDLPAGPELDRLIAEKVMKWTWAYENQYDGSDHRAPSRELVWVEGKINVNQWTPSDPHSIAQAWEVVEQLRAIGCLEVLIVTWPAGGFAAIVENADAHDTGHVLAETAPLAICRAALKAIGHQ